MSYEYMCADCKKVKPWYRFPWDAQNRVDSKKGIACFRCSKDGIPKKEKLEKFIVSQRLERLGNKAMKNKMTDLRNHLFETLEMVKDGKLAIDKAKSICEISQVIINSVKVEIEAMKVLGGGKPLKSEFLQLEGELQSE